MWRCRPPPVAGSVDAFLHGDTRDGEGSGQIVWIIVAALDRSPAATRRQHQPRHGRAARADADIARHRAVPLHSEAL